MSVFEPKTARELVMAGLVPNGNSDKKLGFDIFNMKEFFFYEEERYTSLTSGFIEDFKSNENINILEKFIFDWEINRLSPVIGWMKHPFGAWGERWGIYSSWLELETCDKSVWRRRDDMRIVSRSQPDRWVCLKGDQGIARGTGCQYDLGVTQPLRADVRVSTKDGSKSGSENIEPLKFIRGIPLCHFLPPVELTHHWDGGYATSLVEDCILILWLVINQRDEVLHWQWCGSIYSWKHCRMEPITNSDEATHKIILQMAIPIFREWGIYIDEFKGKAGNPFGTPLFNSDMVL